MKTNARGFGIFLEALEEPRRTGTKISITESSKVGLDEAHIYVTGLNLMGGPPWPDAPNAEVCINVDVEGAAKIIQALAEFIATRREHQEAMYGKADEE